MLNFLSRKDVRKILKRKDSDAGERGRALENLRASLFNELRSSEGAKRQQQRICGPSVALTFNFLVSIAIILMNKVVLGEVGFNFPICLTFIHYVISWLFMAILNAFSILPASPSTKSRFSTLVALGFVMSFSTGLANVSLKYNSVGFYQMAKIAVTPSIVLAEFILIGKRVSYLKVFTLAVVSVGVAVATVSDLQFHFFGACVALAWIIPSATNKILWSNLQQQENWTALAATSAITHVVLGQFKTCVILLGGFFLFGSNPGVVSICGAITALAGMSVYTYLNALSSQSTQQLKTSPKQSKSKLNKEGDDSDQNKNYGEESV
uniref:Sugar phosphate transporter domain-containing protein n=1 Tax=Kalanchoe fedtschenkoi TaxID=63787 RepID=A0A7N1A989_KALFE